MKLGIHLVKAVYLRASAVVRSQWISVRKAGSMRVKSLLSASALGCAMLFSSLTVLARQQDNSQQTGDPVADAARRAREAKQTAPKPRKVYTDDDVSRPKPAPAATSTTDNSSTQESSKPAAGTSAKTPTSAQLDAKAEADWRKRFKEQHENIARAEKELDILQRENQKGQIQYYSDPQKAMTEQYTRKDINEKDAKIAAKQKEIEQLKQGLSDLEDALRKAGGDSGWARE
jgi:chromosome segregation ATPase